MNLKKGLLMALVLCLGIAYILKNPQEVSQEKANTYVIGDTDPNLINKLGFSRKDSVFSLEKSKTSDTTKSAASFLGIERSDWISSEPNGAPVDPYEVENVIDSLNKLKIETTIKENEIEGELTQFGLLPPLFKLSFVANNKETFLYFGREHPISNRRYLQIAGDSNIYLFDNEFFWNIDKLSSELLLKKPFDFKIEPIKEITASSANGLLTFKKSDSGEWTIDSPEANFAIDQELVKESIEKLSNLAVANYINPTDKSVDQAVTEAFKEQWLTIELTASEPAKKILVKFARIKKESSRQNNKPGQHLLKDYDFYFMIDGFPWILKTEKFPLSDLLKPVSHFRNSKPFEKVTLSQIEKIQLNKTPPQQSFELRWNSSQNGEWLLNKTNPESDTSKLMVKVDDLELWLEELKELKFLSFLDNQQQEKTPTLEIVLNFKDGSKQTLLINKPLESSLSSDNSKLIHNDSEDSSPYLAQFQTNNSGLVSVVISREVVKSLNKDPNFFLAN